MGKNSGTPAGSLAGKDQEKGLGLSRFFYLGFP
jgi:hypothetical protein